MADDGRVQALAAYPDHFMNFDKDAFTADVVNAVRSSWVGDIGCILCYGRTTEDVFFK